jgi:hypothetical protein
VTKKDSAGELKAAIERYNEAWNAHDLDSIMAMHAPDMVFENHTAGESAEGEAVRDHIGAIFTTWPDIAFATRRLYVRDGLVVQEWTATATHANRMTRGDLVAEPTGKTVTWDGLDVIPIAGGLVSARTSTRTRSRSCASSGWARESAATIAWVAAVQASPVILDRRGDAREGARSAPPGR